MVEPMAAAPLDSPPAQPTTDPQTGRFILSRMMSMPTRQLSLDARIIKLPVDVPVDPVAPVDATGDAKPQFLNRVVGLPKLHRQLSMMNARSTGRAVPSPEEKVTAQRYERMMDRFQLRRVPLARSASTASSSRARTARKSSGGSFSGLANMARTGSRRLSRTSNNSIAATTAEGQRVDSKLSHSGSMRRSSHQGKVSIVSDVTTAFSTMFLPADVVTRTRLFFLLSAFATKLTYMPYGVAYLEPDDTSIIVIDAVVDFIFLINILATCNTEMHTTRGQLLATRRSVWRLYRDNGFSTDLLATVPFEFLLLTVSRFAIAHWIGGLFKITVQLLCVYRHLQIFQSAWAKEVIGADKSLVAWMLYSRYSHLVRIGGIVVLIVYMAHYFASMWSWLHAETDPGFFTSEDTFVVHLNSIYDSLQLLQGQGVVAKTPAQAVFGSVAVLLGSIALAVVFGHVAILVSNFSANSTTYQHKMERVFSVMGKLQLPHPIRERVHQYYEYLHAEYESLDGEIVKFAKDLSHTLELEVVLFKYMDVLMQVPHWRSCSPDFQKQLVLNLGVRVYLPDDFIMRRGEVGMECYLINRGTCKLYEYPTGNYEPPTKTVAEDDTTFRRPRRSSTSVYTGATPRKPGEKAIIRPMGTSRYSMYDQGPSEMDAADLGPYSRISELTRGQAVGDMALLANYERSSDLRAVSYVEMCVIERETFQRILTRYPRDREIAVASIVRHMMMSLSQQNVPCMLMDLVQKVAPEASVLEGIKYISRAMSPPKDDPSIVFGVSEELLTRLRVVVEELGDGEDLDSGSDEDDATRPHLTANPSAEPSSTASVALTSSNEAGLVHTIQEIGERLSRIERTQQEMLNNSDKAANEDKMCHVCKRRAVASTNPVRERVPIKKIRRRHTTRIEDPNPTSMCPLDGNASSRIEEPLPPSPDSARIKGPTSARTSRPGSQPVSARTTEGVYDSRSPTNYADQLFLARRTFVEDEPVSDGRRSSLRRLRST